MKSLCRKCKVVSTHKLLEFPYDFKRGVIWDHMEKICGCDNYIPSDNLEYLEWKLKQKESKSA